MNPRLAAMLTAVGLTLGGGFLLFSPQPATRSMAELRDAGVTLGQPVVSTCPERLTKQTIRRINAAQPGALRPKQIYGRVARVARCFGSEFLDGGLGNCIKPSDGSSLAPFTKEVLVAVPDGGFEVMTAGKLAEVVVPSLRQNLNGIDDAGLSEDGGEDTVDDALQYEPTSCVLSRCSQFDAGDGTNFCARLNRLQLVSSPCMIPLCIASDGGWDSDLGEAGHGAVVDCRFSGPYGTADGGPRWRGCNTGPAQYASGTACVPVECNVVGGDFLEDEFR